MFDSVREGAPTNVVLHLRRGDAIGRQRAFGTSPAYYVAAVRALRRLHPRAQFWLASDTHFSVFAHNWEMGPDPGQAAARSAIDADRAALVALRHALRAASADTAAADVLTDFRRMLHADVLVLGASSLSYAAALLASGRNRTVIAPACWPKLGELARDALAVKAFALLPYFTTAPCVNSTGALTGSVIPGAAP